MKNNYFKEQAKEQLESSNALTDKTSSQNLDNSQKFGGQKPQRLKSVVDTNKQIIQLNDISRLQSATQQSQYQQQQMQQQVLGSTQTNLITSKISLADQLEDEQQDNDNFHNDSANQIFQTAVGQIRTMQKFANKLSSVFNKKQQDVFIKLREDLEHLMEQFDEKVVEALNKKEYELLKSFQITLEKMTKELQECQLKLNDFNLQVELDIKVIGLEKQLRFYRENCNSLNEENIALKDENSKLKHLYNELEQENLWSRQAHLRTQQKLNIMIESNNENLNTTKQSITQKNNLRLSNQDMSTSNQDSAKNTLENLDGTKISKPSRQFKYRDSLIAARKVILLQDNVHQAANIIDQINPRDQLIEQLKEQISNQKLLNKSLSMQLKTNNLPDPTENQIKQLFIKGVNEVQQEILKRNKMLNTLNPNNDQIEIQKFTKFDRIEVISRFFSSLRFLEIIKSMIFDEKCCQNPSKNEEPIVNLRSTRGGDFELIPENQQESSQIPETENNIKAEISHYDYFHLINTNQYDENNMNQANLKKQIEPISNQNKDTEEIKQNQNINRLYQIKQRTNISYYHSSQNQSQKNYKKNRSNSHSSTAYSGYQLGFSDGQSTNQNTFRDNTYRSTSNNNNMNIIVQQNLNQSFEGNLQDNGDSNVQNGNNSFIFQQNAYHKQLKSNFTKQKQNQLEINNMHRKFHRYNKEFDCKKPQIEPQITSLINTLTSRGKSTVSGQQIVEFMNIKEKDDKIIFKNNKIY